MFFVPYVPPPPTASPRARELANRLKQEIDSFTRQHPGTRPDDVRQAAILITERTGGSQPEARRAVAALLAGLAAAGVMAAVLFGRAGGRLPPIPVPAIAIGVVLAGLLVVVLRRRE